MFENFDWIEAMRTSPVMVIIVGCSVVMVGFALERVLYFRRRRDDVQRTAHTVLELVRNGDLRGAARECARSHHPFGSVAVEVLNHAHARGSAADEVLQIALADQRLLLDRNLGVLGTLGNTAPLIGLLGTVWGIMRAFADMAASGSAGPSVVAAGVAEALFTTAASLLVAVPAVLLYNHLTRRMNVMLTVAESQARRVRLALETGSPTPSVAPARQRPTPVAAADVEVAVRG
jgi:biopolymer transport protein ExbB/TolQ